MPLPVQKTIPGLRDYLGLPKNPSIPYVAFTLEAESWLDGQDVVGLEANSGSVAATSFVGLTNTVPDGQIWQVLAWSAEWDAALTVGARGYPSMVVSRGGSTVVMGLSATPIEWPVGVTGELGKLGEVIETVTLYGGEALRFFGANRDAAAHTLLVRWLIRRLLSR